MKRMCWFLVLVGCWMGGRGQVTGFYLEGQGSVTIPVTLNKMTNVVFPSAVRTGVKVSVDVLVQKVHGVENVIELKAMRRGFMPTNLSVYGADGRLYSFLIRYVDDTTVLNFRVVVSASGEPAVVLSGLPVNESQLASDAAMLAGRRPFLHVVGTTAGVRLRLEGIWLRDSLIWFSFRIRNRGALGFSPGRMRFILLDRERVKRRAVQNREIPLAYGTAPVVAGREEARFVMAFAPFVVPPGKRLIIELIGQDGRQLRLQVRARDVMRVRVGQ